MIRKLLENRHVSMTLKALLTLGIIWAIFSRMKMADMATSITEMNVTPFLLSSSMVIFNIFFQIAKWHMLLRTTDNGSTMGQATSSLLGGIGLSLITPGRIGDVGRIFLIPSRNRLELGALYVLDKGSNSTMMMASGLAGAAMVFPPSMKILYFVFFLLLMGFWLSPSSYGILFPKRAEPPKSEGKWHRFVSSLSTHNLPVRLMCLLWAFAFYAVCIVQYYLLVEAFGKANFSAVAVSFPLMSLAGTLPTIGGVGPREWVCQQLLPRFGEIGQAGAVNAAIFLYITNVLLPGIAGWLIMILRLRINVTDILKKVKRQP